MKEISTSGSIISLDLVAMIISDLNKELHYKITENSSLVLDNRVIYLSSDGDNHSILFAGDILWSSELEKKFENISLLKEIELNERKPFEKYLRNLINDKINQFKHLEM